MSAERLALASVTRIFSVISAPLFCPTSHLDHFNTGLFSHKSPAGEAVRQARRLARRPPVVTSERLQLFSRCSRGPPPFPRRTQIWVRSVHRDDGSRLLPDPLRRRLAGDVVATPSRLLRRTMHPARSTGREGPYTHIMTSVGSDAVAA